MKRSDPYKMRHEENIEVVRDSVLWYSTESRMCSGRRKNGAIKIRKKETEYCIKGKPAETFGGWQVRDYTYRREAIPHIQSGCYPETG